jgi:hypothetical protein
VAFNATGRASASPGSERRAPPGNLAERNVARQRCKI